MPRLVSLLFWVSLIIVIAGTQSASIACGSAGCICQDAHASCASLKLDEVPSDLPANITSLDLQGNSIVYVRDLALARYTDLESISFAENNIVAILANAFKGPRNLSHVDLANNELALLQTGALAPLEDTLLFLNMSNNELTSLPNATVASLSRLQVLGVSNNKLTAWPDQLPQSLRVLHIAQNAAITTWPPPGLLPAGLEGLDVSYLPNLGAIPSNLCGALPRLQNFSACGIGLRGVDSALFLNCSDIAYVDLSSNYLPEIPPLFSSSSGVRSLTLNNDQITTIDYNAFYNLTSLALLFLEQNLISVIDPRLFASLSNLLILNLGTNNLGAFADETFAALSSLLFLDLGFNKIDQLPSSVSALSSLTVLNISGNALTSLAPDIFASMANLSIVTIRGSDLSVLPPSLFEKNPKLYLFELTDCNIDSIDVNFFAHTPNVGALTLSGLTNVLSLPDNIFLPLAHSLRALEVGSNSLMSTFPSSIARLCNLSTFQAQNAAFHTIPDGFFDCFTQLNTLLINGNGNLPLPYNLLRNATQISHINLSNNGLTTLPFLPRSTSFLYLAGNNLAGPFPPALYANDYLRFLTLEGNSITSLTPFDMLHFPIMFYINLEGNLLTELPDGLFKYNEILYEVLLSYNQISRIGADAFPLAVEELQLDGNPLGYTLTDDTFGNLTHCLQIMMGQCQLTYLPPRLFAGLPSLIGISLQVNNIAAIPAGLFDHNPRLSLIIFDTAGPFTTLPPGLFDHTPLAQEIDFSNNTIEYIPCGLFDHTPALTTINLEVNSLRNVSACWLNALTQVTQLSLAGNNLTDVGSALAGLTNLESLSLASNHLDFFPLIIPASVKYLSLNNNYLRTINTNTLRLLPLLLKLDLSFNHITTAAAQPIVLAFNSILEINLANNLLTGQFLLPTYTSLNLANNQITYASAASPGVNPQLLGTTILNGNQLPAFTCTPGTYGDAPACNGFCDPFCLEELQTTDGIVLFSSCSGPSPRDCCPYGLSGTTCQYFFRCVRNVCAPGTCNEPTESDPFAVTCNCPAGMLSYRPTSPETLAIGNTPLCLHACDKAMFKTDGTCVDCNSKCQHGCSGPSSDDCLNPQLVESIAGGVTGAAVLLLLLLVGTFFYRRSRMRARAAQRKYVELHDNVERYWLVPHSDLVFEKKIARGAFGEVWKADWAGRSVAVKKLRQAVVEGDPSAYTDFEKEISFYKQHLRHRNLCSFYGAGVDPRDKAPFLVLEYMERGSLRAILDDNDTVLTWDVRLSVSTDVGRGMRYLHEQSPPILHRDLKASNVFCSERWVAKVGDLGESRLYSMLRGETNPATDPSDNSGAAVSAVREPLLGHESTRVNGEAGMTSHRGTLGWQAPEVCRLAPYGLAADVFSYGVTLWEIASREIPFSEYGSSEAFRVAENIVQGLRPPIPQETPVQFASLIQECWHVDENQRPTFKQILTSLENINE